VVTDPRATLGVDELRALNAPVGLEVLANPTGRPEAVRRADWPAPRRITQVHDLWRIDDEWWRERPISRLYYRVLLEDGMTVTVYHDLVDGCWYEQRYGAWSIPVRRFRSRTAQTHRPAARSRQPKPVLGHGDLPRIRTEP
jgi:hypothetical protein